MNVACYLVSISFVSRLLWSGTVYSRATHTALEKQPASPAQWRTQPRTACPRAAPLKHAAFVQCKNGKVILKHLWFISKTLWNMCKLISQTAETQCIYKHDRLYLWQGHLTDSPASVWGSNAYSNDLLEVTSNVFVFLLLLLLRFHVAFLMI